MRLVKFLSDMDTSIGDNWKNDSEEQKYTEEEAKIATVLTRLDMSLTASLLGYIANTLNSIRAGVWVLVVLGVAHLVLRFIG